MIKKIKRFMQGQGKQNRLFLKILFYFLSLLIPIVIIGISEYWYSVHIIKTEFNERISANLESATGTIDLYIKTTQETGVNFLNDDTINRLLMPRDEWRLEVESELWRIPRILRRNENIVNDFTDYTFVYIDHMNVYVSAGLNNFDSFFNNMYKYEQYDEFFWLEKQKEAIKSIEILPMSTVIQDKSKTKQVIPIVMSQKINNHHAVMVVNISVNEIENTLKGNAIFESTKFIVLDDKGDILNDNIFVSKEQVINLAHKDELDINGERYVVSHVKSDRYGWDYYSFTPLSEFTRQTSSILQMTVLLSIVLIVMGVLFSFIFSFRIYNPIRNIREIIEQKTTKDIEFNEKRSVDVFDEISQAIQHLSISQQEYKGKYDKYTSEYVEYSFTFLLKGHTLNEEDILRDALKADFGFTRKGFICCTVFFDFKDAFYEDIQDAERLYVINGIKKIIWSILNRNVSGYLLEHRQNVFVCIVNVDGWHESDLLHKAFQQMFKVFEYDIQLYYDITIGIGSYYTEINHIADSYNEAMTAVSKRNKEKRFQIVEAHQIEIENSYEYSLFDEQKILNYLKLVDLEAVSSVVASRVDSNVQRGISYDHILQLFKKMYTTGVRFAAEHGLQLEIDEELMQFNDPTFGESFINTPTLRDILIKFYAQIIESIQEQNEQRPGDLASMIKTYIEKNYTQDLGLEKIAEEMGVSVKYVSRVFREKTGVYLTDHINYVRVKKAKQLLVETDLRVSDIAEQTGIHSRTTFLRVFKKVEGISPSEYRKLNS